MHQTKIVLKYDVSGECMPDECKHFDCDTLILNKNRTTGEAVFQCLEHCHHEPIKTSALRSMKRETSGCVRVNQLCQE